ncbi:MAG TPA: hypothetical protein ENO01_00230 [Candidatus Marinimicrobia bacterium]|nr:hypothetical protein [Candidatus Neomarinimicrobiota bacterium]
MKKSGFYIITLIFTISTVLQAAEAKYYLEKYNDQMNRISTLSAKMLVSSRLPGLTLVDQQGMLRYESPDKVDISGGLKEIIPPEAILINLHHVLMDSAVLVNPDVSYIAAGVQLDIVFNEGAGRLNWSVTMDTLRWYIRELDVQDPAGNRVHVIFRQRAVMDDIWLPRSVEVETIPAEENKRVPNPRRQQIPRSDSQSGKMTVRLSDYKINDPGIYEFFRKSAE